MVSDSCDFLFVNTLDSKIHVVVNGNVHITFVTGLQVKQMPKQHEKVLQNMFTSKICVLK